MLTDRGVSPSFGPDDLQTDWLEDCTALHVPAYSLVRQPIGATALRAAGLAREQGASLSLDLSGPAAIEEVGAPAFRELVAQLAPDTVFGTEAEFALAGDVRAPTVVEKRGADGFVVGGQAFAALPAEVVDTTGAGDALAAGFLVGGHELALEAAARCVARMGAFPA
jgi:sugar/nucleoside kinase (ribokinase family)